MNQPAVLSRVDLSALSDRGDSDTQRAERGSMSRCVLTKSVTLSITGTVEGDVGFMEVRVVGEFVEVVDVKAQDTSEAANIIEKGLRLAEAAPQEVQRLDASTRRRSVDVVLDNRLRRSVSNFAFRDEARVDHHMYRRQGHRVEARSLATHLLSESAEEVQVTGVCSIYRDVAYEGGGYGLESRGASNLVFSSGSKVVQRRGTLMTSEQKRCR